MEIENKQISHWKFVVEEQLIDSNRRTHVPLEAKPEAQPGSCFLS